MLEEKVSLPILVEIASADRPPFRVTRAGWRKQRRRHQFQSIHRPGGQSSVRVLEDQLPLIIVNAEIRRSDHVPTWLSGSRGIEVGSRYQFCPVHEPSPHRTILVLEDQVRLAVVVEIT